MRYCISDLHGKYELFQKLLNVIHFSEQDTMYICGDIIDKGESSIRLAKYISSFPNMHCILGNHEYAFLQYYHSILQTSPNDFDVVLKKLQSYFPVEDCPLDWDLVDWFDGLPTYIEEDDFICVHAGIPVDAAGRLVSLSDVSVGQLVNDRRFKNPGLVHTSPKCVFFGHTQTDCICGEPKILAYRRDRAVPAKCVADYYKVHLDTGAWSNGVLGCFCIDTCRAFYVK